MTRCPNCGARKLEPIRTMHATSPSGVDIVFRKFSESDKELSWYTGNLTVDEDRVWWKAKLAAEKPGVEQWEKAAAMLRASKWIVAVGLLAAQEIR